MRILVLIIMTLFSTFSLAETAEQTLLNATEKPSYSKEDALINAEIQKRLKTTPALLSPNILISVNQGIVTIKGNFNTLNEALKVIEMANSIPGVLDINTAQIVLTDGIPAEFNDAVIVAKIKGILVRENVLRGKPVSDLIIESRDGNVQIVGTVETLGQAKQIEQLAKAVVGVNTVVAKLELRFP